MLCAVVNKMSLLSIYQLLTKFPIALIVYRLWRSQRLMEPGRNNFKLLPVMVMVIESGAIYSSALVCVVVTYTSRNNEQYIILDFVRSFSLSVVSRAESYHIVYSTAPIADGKSISIFLEYEQLNENIYTRASSSP
jgi:hypothetical protein